MALVRSLASCQPFDNALAALSVVCQETLLPGNVGIILDERSLESRTVMKQVTQVVKSAPNVHSVLLSQLVPASAGGVTKCSATRYFMKINESVRSPLTVLPC